MPFLTAELVAVGGAPPTLVVVLPVLGGNVGAPWLCRWLAFSETSASPMRAHVGAALVPVDTFGKPRVGAVLELRTQVGARGVFALARVDPPVAPAIASW